MKVFLSIDSREPHSAIKTFEKIFGTKAKVVMQETDILTEHLAIERKQINDLLNSSRGRIFDEVDRMVQYYPERLHIVWVHGNTMELIKQMQEKVGFTPKIEVMYGALGSLFVRYGVFIIWTTNLVEGAFLFKKIEQKIKEGKLGKPRVRQLVKGEDRRVQMLCTFFRISRTTAKDLLMRFKTVKGVMEFLFNARDEDLLEISGIGPTTLKKLKFIIHGMVE